MSNWKMKFAASFLFIVLLLIESTAGRCQLQATVRTTEVQIKEGESETVYQTQLELLCSSTSCPMTNFTTCDTYTDLNIPRDCTGDDCSMEFHLCRNRCPNDRREQPTELPTAPNPQLTTDSITTMPTKFNACPINTSCTSIMITTTTTVSPNSTDCTASTREQNCFNATSTVLSTITKTQEMTLIITHTTTPTPWTTQCPQTTTELMTTTTTNKSEISESMPCTPIYITSTKFIATTVLPPQFTTTPKLNITKSPTTSLGLESCSGNKPGVSTQGNGSSTTISALGALLGLSLVLLALVSIGWVWTCWTARKRGEVNINSKTNNFPNTPGTVTINNNTDTLRRVQNPLYEETTINGGILSLSEAEIETGRGENEETGPTYEIIPLPAPVIKKVSKKRGSIQLEREETATASVGGRVSVGVVSVMNDDSTQDNNIGAIGGGNMNPYYLPDENTKGEESERSSDRDQENDYHLLGDEEEEKKERARENVYQVVVNPMDTEEDYADPDEEEMNNIYHVLEGPTPKKEEEEEESEGEKAEREKTTEGEEEERERDKVEMEEPLTEPAAYEIPLVSSSKHNSTVLQ